MQNHNAVVFQKKRSIRCILNFDVIRSHVVIVSIRVSRTRKTAVAEAKAS